MSDPLSSVALGAAIGGAAGKFAEKAWDSGEKWLSSFYKDHHPKVVERATTNSLKFIAALAQRVNKLEDAARASEDMKVRIVSVLEDPAFSALLKDSLLESAKTENEKTHRLLARLVAERLQCESNNLLALTIPLACDAVKSLTYRQLQFLAIATIIECIFAYEILCKHPSDIHTFCVEWFEKRLPQILPKEDISDMDLRHLVGISCIHVTVKFKEAFPENRLARSLAGGRREPEFGQIFSFVEGHITGRVLADFWRHKLSNISLTSYGILIGACAFEEICGDAVDLQTYFS